MNLIHQVFNKPIRILLLILLLATLLRFYQLGSIPMGLFGDEVDAGYNAYSFLHTGKDYNGNFFPIHFESMGDYRVFLFIWSLVPGIAIFGTTDFGVRFGPALWGVLGVLSTYWLTHKLNMSPHIAIVSSFFLAILPWHLHYSRAAFEVTLMTTLLMASLALLLAGLQKPRLLLLAAFLFALNSYSYSVAKIFSPALLGVSCLLLLPQLRKLPRHYLVFSAIIFTICFSPLVYDTIWGPGNSRFSGLNISNTPDLATDINFQRGQESSYQSSTAKFFHNKPLTIISIFLDQYANAFSPRFLFSSGDEHNPRHSLPHFGLLYFWMWPFFILGLIFFWQNLSNPYLRIILAWLILAPVPSALTLEGGQHATRLAVMIPPLVVISASGAVFAFEYLKSFPQSLRVTCRVGFSLLVIGTMSVYLHQYFAHYSQTNYRWWSYGMRQALDFVTTNQDGYDQIVFTRTHTHLPMLYAAYYLAYPPAQMHQQFADHDAGKVPLAPPEQLGKLRFATLNDVDAQTPNLLYIASPWEVTGAWSEVGRIAAPDPQETNPVLVFLESSAN